MINKKLYLLLSLVLGLGLLIFVSCGDDDNKRSYDKVWKDFNDSLFLVHNDSLVKYGGEYTRSTCFTKDGDFFWKRSSEITPVEKPGTNVESTLGNQPKVSQDGNPTSNDTVIVRYMGWYYTKNTDGEIKKVVFDGTEGKFNRQQGSSFDLGATNLSSGFSSMLQLMDVKGLNQVQVAFPYKLAYGVNSYSSTNSLGETITIPGYTTLYFNILLLKIKPVNPDEFPEVDLGK